MRATGNRWLYWWNRGYRDAQFNYVRSVVPGTYLLSYRTGWRQGSADRAARKSA